MDLDGQLTSSNERPAFQEPSGVGQGAAKERRDVQQAEICEAREENHQGSLEFSDNGQPGHWNVMGKKDHQCDGTSSKVDHPRTVTARDKDHLGYDGARERDTSETDTDHEDGPEEPPASEHTGTIRQRIQAFWGTPEAAGGTSAGGASPSRGALDPLTPEERAQQPALGRVEDENPWRSEAYPQPVHRRKNTQREHRHDTADTSYTPRNGDGMRDWLGRLAGQAPTWPETLAGSQASAYAHPYLYHFPFCGLETQGMATAEKPLRTSTGGPLHAAQPPLEDTRTHEALRRLSAHCHLLAGVKLLDGRQVLGPRLDSVSALEDLAYSGCQGSISPASLGKGPSLLEDSRFLASNWHLGFYPPAWSQSLNHLQSHHSPSMQATPENGLSPRRKEYPIRRDSVLHLPIKDSALSPVKPTPGPSIGIPPSSLEGDQLGQDSKMPVQAYRECHREPGLGSEGQQLDLRSPFYRGKTPTRDTQSYPQRLRVEPSQLGPEATGTANSELPGGSLYHPTIATAESKDTARFQSTNQSIPPDFPLGDRLLEVSRPVEGHRAVILAQGSSSRELLMNHSQRDCSSEYGGGRARRRPHDNCMAPDSCRDGEPCRPLSTRTPVEEDSRAGHSSKAENPAPPAAPVRNHTKMKQTWLTRHSEQFSGHPTSLSYRGGTSTPEEDILGMNRGESGPRQGTKRPCECISDEEPRVATSTAAKRTRKGQKVFGSELEGLGPDPKDCAEPKCKADPREDQDMQKGMCMKKSGEQTKASLQSVPCLLLPEGIERCCNCRSQNQEESSEATCRFLHFRRLALTAGSKLEVDGLCMLDEGGDDGTMEVVSRDGAQSPSPAKYLLSTLGDQFCEIIRRDREALSWSQRDHERAVAWRKQRTGLQVCDVCRRAFFNSHWSCSRCGFQMCCDCHKSRNKTPEEDRGEEEDLEVECVRGPEHSLRFLVLTQFISTPILSHLWKAMHDMRVKYDINANCHCRHSFLTDAVLLGFSVAKDKEMKGTQTPPLQPADSEKPELKAIKEEQPEPEEHSLDDQGAKGAMQNSTLCDLLTSTAVKLCLGQTGVRMAFAPVSTALPTDDRISSILDNIIAQVVERKIQEKQQADIGEARSPSPQEAALYCSVPPQGGILWLQDPSDTTNYRRFQDHWRQCQQPVLVSGLNKNMKTSLWGPGPLRRELKQQVRADSPSSGTHAADPINSKEFWDNCICSSETLQGEKIRGGQLRGEWGLQDLQPCWIEDLNAWLPLPEYCRPGGKLNLATYLPGDKLWLCPRIAASQGMKFDNQGIGTKSLAAEVTDFLNVLVHMEDADRGFCDGRSVQQEIFLRTDGEIADGLVKEQLWTSREPPGALWHIFQAEDAEQIQRFLKKACGDQGPPGYLDLPLRRRLREECGVRSWSLLQFLGDAVLLPAGSPYQVHYFTNTISVNQAFLSPENAILSAHLMHSARKTQPTNENLSAQMEGAIFGAVKEAVETLQAYN
ncbi:lysine-specific demethylase hairless [Ambystoma mexicanum]|uniref:lysine-specific demethylase hairless n=1 Tax=Ambystoma mexicanum TaxID=8296 RepID=UPI0037E7E872